MVQTSLQSMRSNHSMCLFAFLRRFPPSMQDLQIHSSFWKQLYPAFSLFPSQAAFCLQGSGLPALPGSPGRAKDTCTYPPGRYRRRKR